jgi:exosortase/archaeosortase family protein
LERIEFFIVYDGIYLLAIIVVCIIFLTIFPKRRPRKKLWWVWLSALVALPVPALMNYLRIYFSLYGFAP